MPITFEELQALIDSREIDLSVLPESALDNASYFGRIFARCGGLADAVAEALKEQGITEEQFRLKATSCDGIEACRIALLKAPKICCLKTLLRVWPASAAAWRQQAV